ncbi:hypothetical protein NPIL_64651 [Nephila pilipes]|uniref:Uncharacterized protein n=1 Tax=Nephila pilipes TaxID=299642 RepID=A0A8X6TFP8_NEPPI|nr:hypothetical protein NPIL_64651 [Nephila pilipes]
MSDKATGIRLFRHFIRGPRCYFRTTSLLRRINTFFFSQVPFVLFIFWKDATFQNAFAPPLKDKDPEALFHLLIVPREAKKFAAKFIWYWKFSTSEGKDFG